MGKRCLGPSQEGEDEAGPHSTWGHLVDASRGPSGLLWIPGGPMGPLGLLWIPGGPVDLCGILWTSVDLQGTLPVLRKGLFSQRKIILKIPGEGSGCCLTSSNPRSLRPQRGQRWGLKAFSCWIWENRAASTPGILFRAAATAAPRLLALVMQKNERNSQSMPAPRGRAVGAAPRSPGRCSRISAGFPGSGEISADVWSG